MKLPDHSLYRYIRNNQALDACRLGWLPLPSLNGTHHAQYSVLMAWLCSCDPAMPKRGAA